MCKILTGNVHDVKNICTSNHRIKKLIIIQMTEVSHSLKLFLLQQQEKNIVTFALNCEVFGIKYPIVAIFAVIWAHHITQLKVSIHTFFFTSAKSKVPICIFVSARKWNTS